MRNPRTWECVVGTASGCNTADGIEMTTVEVGGVVGTEVLIPVVDFDLHVYLLSFNGGTATVSYSWGCPEVVATCRPCAEYECEGNATPICDGSASVFCMVT